MHERRRDAGRAIAPAIVAALLAHTVPARAGDAEAAEAPALARFLARPDEPVTSYRAVRRMTVTGVGREAWMSVRVTLDPVNGFRWSVEREGGSRLLRDKCLLGVLEGEAEAYAAGHVRRAGLTADNYEIGADGLADGGLVRLRARARRREPALVDGFFVVTEDTAELVRVEGRLARGPSFWVPRADVVRHFARVGGHRVVIRSESFARLRLLGDSRLLVSYDYEMINGDEVRPPADAMAGLDVSGRQRAPLPSAAELELRP